MYALEVNGLTKKYNDFYAVDNLSFTAGEGMVFGLLGPNGSGKTTTLNMLCGLITPSAGSAKIMGYDIATQIKDVRRVLGVVPQETALYDSLTAEENLEFHAALYGIAKKDTKSKIDEILQLTGLTERRKSKVGTYSGGMKRRLALGRALMAHPKIIFLDEPTLGVDVQSRSAIWEHIIELKKKGIVVILTTNYMEEADCLADTLAIIDHGKLVVTGSPADIKAQVGEEIIEMIVQDLPGSTEERLCKIPGVQKLRKEGLAVYLTVKDGSKVMLSVLEALKEDSVQVDTFTLKKISLNEAFLAYTGKKLRD